MYRLLKGSPLVEISQLFIAFAQGLLDPPEKTPEGSPLSITTFQLLFEEEIHRSQKIDYEQLLADIKHVLLLFLPNSLSLTYQVEFYFLYAYPKAQDSLFESLQNPNLQDLLQNLSTKIRQNLWQTLVQQYCDQPEKLQRALQGAGSACLRYICWGRHRTGTNQLEGLPFTDWPKFATSLLKATQLYPQVLLPQLASLIVHFSDEHDPTFDPELCTRLFGDVESVLQLFREHAVSVEPTREIEAVLRAVPMTRGDAASVEPSPE